MAHRHAKGISGRMEISREAALEKMGRLAAVMGWVCCIAGIFALLSLASSASLLVSIGTTLADKGAEVQTGEAGSVLLATPTGGTSIGLINGGRNMIGTLLGQALCIGALLMAGRFFRAVGKTRRPFTTERAHDLQRIGVLLTAAGLGSRLVGVCTTLAVFAALGYDGSWSFGEVFDPAALAAGVCVLMFARVFEYGCVLQEQDDGLV